MAWKVGLNKKVNISRVVTKIVVTVLGLYVGGTILDAIGDVMYHTASPLYGGLSLIGWTVGAFPKNGTSFDGTGWHLNCAATTADGWSTVAVGSNCITATTGSGVLTVIGIVGIASVIMEFVTLKMS